MKKAPAKPKKEKAVPPLANTPTPLPNPVIEPKKVILVTASKKGL